MTDWQKKCLFYCGDCQFVGKKSKLEGKPTDKNKIPCNNLRFRVVYKIEGQGIMLSKEQETRK